MDNNEETIVVRKHRGRKSKAELLQIAIQNGTLPPSSVLSTKQSTTHCDQQQQKQKQHTDGIEANTSGFDVDRAAIYNSMLPKEIVDEEKWRWSALCRKIMDVSDAVRALADRLTEHRVTADDQKDLEKTLRTISENTKRLADSAEWMQIQLVSGISATINNPEMLGHGSLTQTMPLQTDDIPPTTRQEIFPSCKENSAVVDIIR